MRKPTTCHFSAGFDFRVLGCHDTGPSSHRSGVVAVAVAVADYE
jgi:hypothetical protein